MNGNTEGIVPLRHLSSLNPLQPPKLPQELAKCIVQRVKIDHSYNNLDHHGIGILHLPKKVMNFTGAVILISGAGGGTSGPAGIYVSLANKIARLCSLPVIRLDYREPAETNFCTEDILGAMEFMNNRLSTTEYVVIGWSFGSAPAFTAAARDERIRGVACVAPQTAETSGVTKLAPRPMLLLHGTGDRVLHPRCSKQLFESYGDSPEGDRSLKLYEGDDHGLTHNAMAAEEALFHFVAKVLGKEEEVKKAGEAVEAELIGDRSDRVRVMKEGHDLDGERL